MLNKLLEKLIILLIKILQKKISTIFGEKPEGIYYFKNEKKETVGILFLNPEERDSFYDAEKYTILARGQGNNN